MTDYNGITDLSTSYLTGVGIGIIVGMSVMRFIQAGIEVFKDRFGYSDDSSHGHYGYYAKEREQLLAELYELQRKCETELELVRKQALQYAEELAAKTAEERFQKFVEEYMNTTGKGQRHDENA